MITTKEQRERLEAAGCVPHRLTKEAETWMHLETGQTFTKYASGRAGTDGLGIVQVLSILGLLPSSEGVVVPEETFKSWSIFIETMVQTWLDHPDKPTSIALLSLAKDFKERSILSPTNTEEAK